MQHGSREALFAPAAFLVVEAQISLIFRHSLETNRSATSFE